MRANQDLAEEFLKTSHLYQLGNLATESCHPDTLELSRLAMQDLPRAYQVLRTVDQKAMDQFSESIDELSQMQADIQATLASGGRIFLCGCGATGRLSLSLEYFWRRSHPQEGDRVVGFMAGGDVALVHALEGFEDFPEYGARHLMQLGFRDGDLLISSTEGGETPFVIGATEKAAEISKRSPYFLYCNPKDLLIQQVDRSRRVLTNSAIRSIGLFVGPMALAGSTRMQASTVLMMGIGLALLRPQSTWQREWGEWRDALDQLPLLDLCELTEQESQIYQDGNRTLYAADESAITVMTDTTERAPTFSLSPFDNSKYPKDRHSLTYLYMPQYPDTISAWRQLLGRSPRHLEWTEINMKTGSEYLMGFDFSRHALEFRKRLLPGVKHFVFDVDGSESELSLELNKIQTKLPRLRHDLWTQLLLKVSLNMHSTLIMGRLGRYEGNLMTYVKPTNGKLIDRSTRYIRILLQKRGITQFSYADVVKELFHQTASLAEDEPIVLKTLQALERRTNNEIPINVKG